MRPVWSHPGARRFPHRLLEDFGDERCILVSRPEPVVHVVVGALEEAGQQA